MSGGGLNAGSRAVIKMGNDIARQFATRPADEAIAAIEAHLTKFWDPRMIAELIGVRDNPELDPLVAAAALLLEHAVSTR